MMEIISFGHRCSSAGFIEMCGFKKVSYPFDWCVSKLEIIKDCIETNFVHFSNKNNYKIYKTETFNMNDEIKNKNCFENTYINTYYDKYNINTSTYNYNLAFNHYNPIKNEDYYNRCIQRFQQFLNKDSKKCYIYFHPIIGIKTYENDKNSIIKTIDDFNKYILTVTKIFGINFILIYNETDIKSNHIIKDENYDVYILYCNKDFLDGGKTFTDLGNNKLEKAECINIIKKYV